MRWNGNDYDKMAQLVIDIYLDYGFTEFPLDEKLVCKKLGIKLIPYSEYSDDDVVLLMKKSEEAFYSPQTRTTPPTIFYNDNIKSEGRKRYSIFHEIKHYVNGDKKEGGYVDDMADYFARYCMCPIPYLIKNGVDDQLTIISDFGLSGEASSNALKNVRNRKRAFGEKIFDYEKPLIEQLCPDDDFDVEF